MGNESSNFGLGIVGDLSQGLKFDEFVELTKKSLYSKNLRVVAHDKDKIIKKVAVCGGSGSSFWSEALRHQADIYISSEFNHHSYLETKKYINIIDATHHTTEKFVVEGFYNYLKNYFDREILVVSKEDIDPVEIN